jgi:HD-GYP domain-containing protein (c-di-GMP phosphodiesterase class II)
MKAQGPDSRKRIPVTKLRPGMYVVELDRAWIHTPFAFHSRRISNAGDIELLARNGIREVVIDTARGFDELPQAGKGDQSAQSEQRRPALPASTEPNEPEFDTRPSLKPLLRELPLAKKVHEEALATAESVFDGVGRGSPLNSPAAKETVTALLASISRSPEANLLLTQMRRFENELFTHAVNVCVLSMVVATTEGCFGDIPELGLGALLHDVGQVRLPRNLMRKKTPFTAQERRLTEQHPLLGAAIVERAENVPTVSRRIVIEHHERLNGSGYPAKALGSSISPLTQIVAITDAYDAMITGRNGVLQKPIDVLKELYLDAQAGAFDGNLVERVIRCLGVYPVGSLVELNTGERGIVVAPNRSDTLKPTIRLILSRDGLPLVRGPVIHLAHREGNVERQIVRTLDPGKEHVHVIRHLDFEAGGAPQ